MSVSYIDVHTYIDGVRWQGKVLAGASGVPELCMSLDNSGVVLCKDRPKIKAGCIGGYFIKRYNLPGFFTQFRRRFKTPRPYKVLKGALQLAGIGILTPEVIGALVETRNWVRREYLVTAQLSESCESMMKYFAQQAAPEDIWQKLCSGIIPVLGRLHGSGWLHGDLSMRNIFYDRAAGEYGFIDLDGMECCGKTLPETERCREIARLVSSYLLMLQLVNSKDSFIRRAIEAYHAATGIRLAPDAVAAAMKPMITRWGKYL